MCAHTSPDGSTRVHFSTLVGENVRLGITRDARKMIPIKNSKWESFFFRCKRRMSQKKRDLKFIREFVNERSCDFAGSVKRATLYTRVIWNLRNFGHRSFTLERNFSSHYVHTHTHKKSRDGAWKLLLTLSGRNWLVCRVSKKIPTACARKCALVCLGLKWERRICASCFPDAKLLLRYCFSWKINFSHQKSRIDNFINEKFNFLSFFSSHFILLIITFIT